MNLFALYGSKKIRNIALNINLRLNNLSENTIKKVAVQFLKAYYKYRPRTGDAKGKIDLISEEGIVSDGQVSFPTEDGNTFVATFEATSAETRNEVLFQKQKKLLWFDSLVIGGLLSTLFLSVSYKYHYLSLQEIRWAGLIAKFLASFLGFAMIYKLLFGGLRRYRHIYAIEQFKQFYANEQWIAIGEDVFENPLDPYLEELKNQCVNLGFGLIEVKKDLTPHLIITPAREEVFKPKKRKALPFLEKVNLPTIPSTSRYSKLWASFNKSVPKSFGSATSIYKFQKNYWQHLSIFATCLLIIGFIFFKEWQREPIAYIEETEYLDQLAELNIIEEPNPEPKMFEVDTSADILTEKSVSAYLNLNDPPPARKTKQKSKNQIYITQNGQRISYGCERFSNMKGEYYLLLESEYGDLQDAMSRLEKLRKANVDAHCIWSGCFKDIMPMFLVYVDLIHTDKKEAQTSSTSFGEKLKRKNLYKGGIMVLPVQVDE